MGIIADQARCAEMVERSLPMAPALALVIGHETMVKIAQQALSTGQTIHQIAQNKELLAKDGLDKGLYLWRMTIWASGKELA